MATNSSQVLSGKLEDRQRLLAGAGHHALLGNADLRAELLEAHVMAVFLHRDPAGQPLGVGGGRVGDGGLVEHLRAVELVDGVADHELGRSASRYSSGASFSSSTVLTTMSVMSCLHQTSGSVLKASRSVVMSVNFGAEPGDEIGRERIGLLDIELGDRPRLAEQEDLAAAHAQQLTGDVLGGGRAERRHEVGDVVRADLERALLVGLLRLVGRLDDVGDAGPRERRHRVGGDLRAGEIHRGDACQAKQAGLGAGIGGLAEVAVEARRRDDVDDAAPVVAVLAAAARLALVAHDGSRGVDQVEGRREVVADHRVPVGGIGAEHEGVAQDRRVVHHDVDAAEVLHRQLDELLGDAGRGDALGEGDCLLADGRQRPRAPATDRHRRRESRRRHRRRSRWRPALPAPRRWRGRCRGRRR